MFSGTSENYFYPIDGYMHCSVFTVLLVQFSTVSLHYALSLAAQCIVIGPVCVCNGWAACVCGCVCLWVCYHDNSKLRASIFTKLGL